MKKLISELKLRYVKRDNLCVNCIYSQKNLYCSQTGKKASFEHHCPIFRLTSDTYYHNKDLLDEKYVFKQERKQITFDNRMFLNRFVISVLLFFLLVFFNFILNLPSPVSISIGVILIVVVVFLFYKKNTHKIPKSFIFNKNSAIAYYYIVFAIYLHKKKENKTEDDVKKINQTVISVFGQKYLSQLRKYLSIGVDEEMNHEFFDRNVSELDRELRILVFVLAAEMFVFNNIDQFFKSKELQNISKILLLNYLEFKQIKTLIEEDEFDYQDRIRKERYKKDQERIRAEDESRRKQAQKNKYDNREYFKQKEKEKRKYTGKNEKKREKQEQTYTNYSYVSKKYYDVLGVSSIASNEEIKKVFKQLALRYHPDRHIDNPEEQHIASEKFKKITEAYNEIKEARKL